MPHMKELPQVAEFVHIVRLLYCGIKNGQLSPMWYLKRGNLLKRDHPIVPYVDHDDLEVLTTSHNLQDRQFETINGTSSACALASNLAGEIASKYPDLWAESIRGLIIHSAQWTDAMYRQFGVNGRNNVKTASSFMWLWCPRQRKSTI